MKQKEGQEHMCNETQPILNGTEHEQENLDAMSWSKDPAVRVLAAEHRNASEEILGRLAADSKVDVRRRVAVHPRTSKLILEHLSSWDPSQEIRSLAIRQRVLRSTSKR